MSQQPLVSCTVITYNSSKYVLETLESIYNQTYPRLELIVSDDCSTDNTVELCKDWIAQHKDRFERVELLEIDHNTGVAANSNRAGEACQGEWRKSIAGDDILLPNCVQDCMDYINAHPEEDIVYLFGKIDIFGGTEAQRERFVKIFNYDFFSWTTKQQYEFLIMQNCIPAAACFTNTEKVKNIGIQNDPDVPLLEDWPKWIRLTKKRIRFHFIDKEIVCYRIHDDSLTTSSKPKPYNPLQSYTHAMFFAKYQFIPQLFNKNIAFRQTVSTYITQWNAYKKSIQFISDHKPYPHQCIYNCCRLQLFLTRVFNWFRCPFKTLKNAKKKGKEQC